MAKLKTPPAQIDELRARIDEIKQTISARCSSLVPFDCAQERVDRFVEAMVERGRPEVGGFATREGRPAWITPSTFSGLLDFIAWVDPEAMKHRIMAEIEPLYEEEAALPTASVDKEVARAREQLFELECQEERLIQAAAEEGIHVGRRIDVDPRALLSTSPHNLKE